MVPLSRDEDGSDGLSDKIKSTVSIRELSLHETNYVAEQTFSHREGFKSTLFSVLKLQLCLNSQFFAIKSINILQEWFYKHLLQHKSTET